MSCCGKKRSAIAKASQTRRRPAGAAPPPAGSVAAPPPHNGAAASPGTGVAVKYTGTDVVRVRGGATGRVYEFSAQRSVVRLHPGDALSVLRRAGFRRA